MQQDNRIFKMLSLFDGSGGFPLCGTLCGIEPIYASEIEPFPIKVTKARFPNMKHLGDISTIHGADLEPVDVATGGSPCQDMSIAGKRNGMSKKCPKCEFSIVGNDAIKQCPDCGAELEYTRSGLFMEQIRVIKEMREEDELRNRRTNEHIRPRFMLWENVPGAFTSNKGEDFRAVLEETARIVDKTASIPRPTNGKWNTDGLIMGNGYSIAWRVLDAQYWGVPQRRRRIALVADFGGQCAGEILFKREGLHRNFTESRKAWQNLTRCATDSVGETSQYSVDFGRTADRIQMNADKAVTLLGEGGEGGGGGAKTGLYCLPKTIPIQDQAISNGSGNGLGIGNEDDPMFSLMANTQHGVCTAEPKIYDVRISSDGTQNARCHCYETTTSRTVDTSGNNPDSNHGGVAICEQICVIEGNGSRPSHRGDGYKESEIMYTLNATEHHAVAYGYRNSGFAEYVSSSSSSTLKAAGGDLGGGSETLIAEPSSFYPQMKAESQCFRSDGICNTLVNGTNPGFQNAIIDTDYIVRRLTPLECSRLQGLPDWWVENIAIENPTEEDLIFWREVFETHRKVVPLGTGPLSMPRPSVSFWRTAAEFC